jgi:hypothetical protein
MVVEKFSEMGWYMSPPKVLNLLPLGPLRHQVETFSATRALPRDPSRIGETGAKPRLERSGARKDDGTLPRVAATMAVSENRSARNRQGSSRFFDSSPSGGTAIGQGPDPKERLRSPREQRCRRLTCFPNTTRDPIDTFWSHTKAWGTDFSLKSFPASVRSGASTIASWRSYLCHM